MAEGKERTGKERTGLYVIVILIWMHSCDTSDATKRIEAQLKTAQPCVTSPAPAPTGTTTKP